MRNYEIHLPLTYSDGKPIEQEKMKLVRDELVVCLGRSWCRIEQPGNMTVQNAWKS